MALACDLIPWRRNWNEDGFRGRARGEKNNRQSRFDSSLKPPRCRRVRIRVRQCHRHSRPSKCRPGRRRHESTPSPVTLGRHARRLGATDSNTGSLPARGKPGPLWWHRVRRSSEAAHLAGASAAHPQAEKRKGIPGTRQHRRISRPSTCLAIVRGCGLATSPISMAKMASRCVSWRLRSKSAVTAQITLLLTLRGKNRSPSTISTKR